MLIVFPNPARDSAEVAYRMDTEGTAKILVYDVNGLPVLQVPLGRRQAGENVDSLDVHGLSSGIYLVFLRVDGLFGNQGRCFKLAVIK
jgi:hypothetical protein